MTHPICVLHKRTVSTYVIVADGRCKGSYVYVLYNCLAGSNLRGFGRFGSSSQEVPGRFNTVLYGIHQQVGDDCARWLVSKSIRSCHRRRFA